MIGPFGGLVGWFVMGRGLSWLGGDALCRPWDVTGRGNQGRRLQGWERQSGAAVIKDFGSTDRRAAQSEQKTPVVLVVRDEAGCVLVTE